MPSNTSKAQQMGEARDRDAMKVLIRALHEHSVGDQQAIRNFCSNATIKDGVKQARINMFKEAASRSLFIEGLPVGTSREVVKALMETNLRAATLAVASSSFELCSVFVNKPSDHTEFMYAVVTMNDIKHSQAILGVMDTGARTRLKIDGVGVSVLLKARAGEAPTAQALARVYLKFIQDKRYKSDLRCGIVPKPPPRVHTMAIRPTPVAIPEPIPSGLRVCSESGLLLDAPTAVAPTWQQELAAGGADEDFCAECECQGWSGHADLVDGEWYCDGCWAKHATSAATTPVSPPQPRAALVKAFSKATPKKMAVFHDAENCYLGKAKAGVSDGDLAFNFHKAVKDMVVKEGGDGSGSWQFFLHHQEHLDNHPSKHTMTGLSDLGVDNIDPGAKLGAVDVKMKANIGTFIDANKDKAEQFIVVILSGDKDFLPEIQELQRAEFATIICHPPDVSKTFLRQASVSGPVFGWQPIRQEAGGLEFGKVGSTRLAGYRATPSDSTNWSTGGCVPQAGGGGGFHFASHDTKSRQWNDLAAIRGVSEGCPTQQDEDAASDVSLTSASQMSSATSVVFDEAGSPSSPSVSIWLANNKLTFAAAALEEFGYDDDMTLLDFTEDVKDEETLLKIMGAIQGIVGLKTPQVNKIKRELNRLAAGETVAAASA